MSITGGGEVHAGGRTDKEVSDMYESWIVSNEKSYNNLGEKETRFHNFKENLKFIDDHNSVERSYTVGLNKFADLSNEEYQSMYCGGGRGSNLYAGPVVTGEVLPDSVARDVGSVKEHGDFTVEGANDIATAELGDSSAASKIINEKRVIGENPL